MTTKLPGLLFQRDGKIPGDTLTGGSSHAGDMGQEGRAQQLDADTSGGITWHFPQCKLIFVAGSHVPRDKGETPCGRRIQSKGLLRICSLARPRADRFGVDFPHFEAILNHGRVFLLMGV